MIGVIGVGKRMCGMIKKVRDELEIDLPISGIYDVSENSIRKFKELFGDTKVYSSFEELINDGRVTWVFIGSPNSFHKNQMITSFENKKNVFCEKPLVTTVKDLMDIKKSYESNDVKFIMSYPLIYSPHYRKIKEIVSSGEIGDVISLEFNETLSPMHGCFIMTDWRRFTSTSGGHLLEKCSHDIAAVNWILDDFPSKVSSFGGLNFFRDKNKEIYSSMIENNRSFDNLPAPKTNPFVVEKDIVDNQVAIIEYKRGARAIFHTNLCSGIPERRMFIHGSRGTLRADVLTGKIEVVSFVDDKKTVCSDSENMGSHGGGDILLLRELCDLIFSESSKSESSMSLAISSTLSVLGIEESRLKGKVVSFKDFTESFRLN
jgi:predicted dehydrogenase